MGKAIVKGIEESKRARFSKEFKLEAVRLLELEQKPARQLAMELGIARNQLYKWQLQLSKIGRAQAFQGPGRKLADERGEVDRLRAELKRVSEERDILKKAAAYFALCPSRVRGNCREVRLHDRALPRVPDCRPVPRVQAFAQWLLQLAATQPFRAHLGRSSLITEDSTNSCGKPPGVWRTQDLESVKSTRHTLWQTPYRPSAPCCGYRSSAYPAVSHQGRAPQDATDCP